VSVYPVPGPEMLIDAVDLQDHSVGVILRRDALPLGENFRVAHLFLFNSRGELLVQQLAGSRDRHPLAWGSSVAAYLFAGESYGEAIARRALQELGLQLRYEEVGRTVMKDAASEKFIALFCARSDGPFAIDDSHIQQLEFLPLPEIEDLMRSGRRTFTPTFQHLFAFHRDVAKGA
jgi:isopentenyldiphosphate isomerase